MGADLFRGKFSRRSVIAGGAAAVIRPLTAQYPKVAAPPGAKMAIRQDRVVLDILHDGAPFAVYNYDTSQAGTYRPFFHPILGPGNRPLTQNGEFPGSLRGHHWHRGLFVAHQKVNDCSFWEERATDCGKIVHLGFDQVESGDVARFRERLSWRNLQGRELLQETRAVRTGVDRAGGRFLDIGIRLTAVGGDVTFHKSAYNLLACRVPDSMCLKPQKERYTTLYGELVDFQPRDRFGVILNSEGQQNEACGGARAKWCDFSGPGRDGSVGGIAILDHPSNPRFPTPWHNWNNMTIISSLTYHEPLVLKDSRSITFTWRVLAHDGDAVHAGVAEAWKRFSETEPLVRET